MGVILRKYLFGPEIIAANIPMGEIHGSLVRFQAGIVLVIGGNRAAHRKTARDRDAASVAQRPASSAKSGTPTAKPVTPRPQSTAHVYIAQAGDSLSAIATRFGVSVQAIMSANGLANPNLVNVGQVLVIPE